jgi:carbamoyltransferase
VNILGISGQEQDAAAALVRDGVVIAAVEEEKLARIRHVGMSYAGGLPSRAIAFCLASAGVSLADIDYLAYYMEPRKLFVRTGRFCVSRLIKNPGWRSIRDLPYYLADSLGNLRQRLRTKELAQTGLSRRAEFVSVNHQLAHAASAFYSSEFDEAAIIVAGNRGDMAPVALMDASAGRIRILQEGEYPHSLGMLYNATTSYLGFDFSSDQHKTMWLSPTGNSEFADVFDDIVKVGRSGLPRINLSYFDRSFTGNPALSERFQTKTGVALRKNGDGIKQAHRDVAASLQDRTEQVLCEMASRLRERTGRRNLCLAGGVALNSLAMAAIEKRSGFERIFIQPASGNAGCSIGAALYVWHELLSHKDRAYRMKHVFLGPKFGEEEIKSVLDNCKLDYEYFRTEDRLVTEVAQLLAKEQIVGWFHGAMEFGPRALGARSILASPRTEVMRENLNVYIKHREDFRPFSAAVPEERAAEFFEPSSLTRYLQTVCKVKSDAADKIPAAVFGKGLARVHTASRDANGTFWKLLVRFGELTGVPVLLNTSFNLFGEPVVSTPREAVRGFYCSGIDCLAIGNFLVRK